ncbi:hypothetical protein ACJ41O_000225 [Fusarium nematophilum]
MMTIKKLIVGLTAFLLPSQALAHTRGNVATHFRNAFAAAGTEHFNLYNMICPRIENANAGKIATPPDHRSGSIDKAVPKKAFESLYYVGEYAFWESSASAWVVDTGEGLVLIDALYPDSVHLIEDGIQALGLDISDLKYLVVGHGHADHYGGAKYLQDTYGVRVMMADAEWEFMYAANDTSDKPAKDLVIEDGQVFTLGDTNFHFFITPGHTPGTVSTIFNVRGEDGQEHKVAQWGGTGFGFNGATGRAKTRWFETYAASAVRFQGLICEHGADVMIANHPGLDNTYAKFEAAGRSSGNPWVIGVEAVLNYAKTAESCARAGVAAYR